jgi:hypothetical protein
MPDYDDVFSNVSYKQIIQMVGGNVVWHGLDIGNKWWGPSGRVRKWRLEGGTIESNRVFAACKRLLIQQHKKN